MRLRSRLAAVVRRLRWWRALRREDVIHRLQHERAHASAYTPDRRTRLIALLDARPRSTSYQRASVDHALRRAS